MLNLEEQIHNLADAAFDATEPVAVPTPVEHGQRRIRLLAVAAVVVVGFVGTVLALTRTTGTDLITVADDPSRVVEITDPMGLDLTGVAVESAQARIQRLGAVTVLDTEALGETFEVERMFVGTTPGVFGPYEYWQQVSVRTTDRVRLVVNVYGTEASWPSLEESAGEEVTVRGVSGRRTSGGIEWLETDQLRIEIVGGPGAGVANIDQASLELAEALSFIETADAWTDDEEDRLGRSVDGDPILAGVVAGIGWDVVETGDELVVRTGDLNRVAFTHQANQDERASYTVTSLALPGGAVIVGYAPAGVDQIEIVLDNGGRVIVPTAAATGDRMAFAIPVDDRLDPTELRLISDGVAIGPAIDLSYLPPYLAGSLSVGI